VQGLAPQLARLNAEIGEQEINRRGAQATARAAKAEAEARQGEAAAAADLARDQEERLVKLAASGLAGRAEVARAESESKQKRAAAETLRLAIARIVAEGDQKDTEPDEIETGAARPNCVPPSALAWWPSSGFGTRASWRITAPVSGTLAEVANSRGGAHIGRHGGHDRPAGRLATSPTFVRRMPGRVHVGQPARLRLTASVHAIRQRQRGRLERGPRTSTAASAGTRSPAR
jgi:hypothetical protein